MAATAPDPLGSACASHAGEATRHRELLPWPREMSCKSSFRRGAETSARGVRAPRTDPPRLSMSAESDLFPNVARVLTVAELTRSIRGLLETRFGAVWVPGRNFQLQETPVRPSVLHPQRSAGRDRLRDFSQHAAALSESIGRRHAGAGLRQRHRFRSARAVSAQRADPAVARTRLVAGKVRGPQAEAGSGRPFRPGAQARAPEIPAPHRHRYFVERRGHPGYPQRSATARSGRRGADQSGARAGDRRLARNRDRDPRVERA